MDRVRRRITMVLCTAEGRTLGVLPPFDVPSPFWRDAREPVAAVLAEHGLDVTVLRLLSVDRSADSEAFEVSVLAQLDSPRQVPAGFPLADVPSRLDAALAEHPLRLPFARPGGPAAEIAWADGALDRLDRPRTGPPEQQRTWNLSAIWRLPTACGPVWLKSVPPFFSHEASMLATVATVTNRVPTLLAGSRLRLLLEDVPGEDLYGASRAQLLAMVRLLVTIQAALVPTGHALLDTGCFDWREGAFLDLAHDVVGRTAGELDSATATAAAALLRDLPGRFAAINECGIPDTLVHGDFHPGNVRGHEDQLVIIDWGDSGFGHPLLDQPAFVDRVPPADLPVILAAWCAAWHEAVPGCEPERAAHLIAPVAALRQAIIYRLFLDRIEDSERVYHAQDPAIWIRRAVS